MYCFLFSRLNFKHGAVKGSYPVVAVKAVAVSSGKGSSC